ncbi:hypothetical protein ABZ832_05225 [Streptantibioticus parmotrematis]|uniref:hypothetical protein n=1 Tax=Streptantibioticus parmotrematis TaxID=2873249 RepID=UPI0033D05DB1
MARQVALLTFPWALAARPAWYAVRLWRDPSLPRDDDLPFTMRVSKSTARGLARGIAVVTWTYFCIAALVTCGVAWSAWSGLRAVGWVFIAGFAGSVPLLVLVVTFNRPRFLVIPSARHLTRADIKAGVWTGRPVRQGVQP